MTVERQLYLLRHAKSDWDEPTGSDHARPLNGRGRRSAVEVASTLVTEAIAPDILLVSSARRTRQTASALSEVLPEGTETSVEDGLYGAPAVDLLGRLRALPDSATTVLLIGHNPGIEELALSLVRPVHSLALSTGMRTASLVGLGIPTTWSDLAPATAELLGRWEHRGEKHR